MIRILGAGAGAGTGSVVVGGMTGVRHRCATATCWFRSSQQHPSPRPPRLFRVHPYSAGTVCFREAMDGSKTTNTNTSSVVGIPYQELIVGIPKETMPRERRVAATPESVSRLIQPGFRVQVERGAGAMAYFNDAAYEAAGATIVDNVWRQSDIVLKVG